MLIPYNITEQVNQSDFYSAKLCASVLLFRVSRKSIFKVRARGYSGGTGRAGRALSAWRCWLKSWSSLSKALIPAAGSWAAVGKASPPVSETRGWAGGPSGVPEQTVLCLPCWEFTAHFAEPPQMCSCCPSSGCCAFCAGRIHRRDHVLHEGGRCGDGWNRAVQRLAGGGGTGGQSWALQRGEPPAEIPGSQEGTEPGSSLHLSSAKYIHSSQELSGEFSRFNAG